jgi:uncharacterized phage protein gp47/JayE
MQWLILKVLQMTRAATSAGDDLDSWVGDFGLARLPAVAATGEVTFSRFTTGNVVLVPVGAKVKTSDSSLTFDVVADAGNAAWDVTQSGYWIPATQVSVTVPVAAEVAGSSGNVQSDTITLMATAIAGVDTVGNSVAFTNGIDVESDVALRGRFRNYINTRCQATATAVGYAVSAVRQGLSWTVQENTTVAMASVPGNFVVTVDDGTGEPDRALLTMVKSAVDAVRPLGSTFQVQGPGVVTANVSLRVAEASGYTHAQAVAAAGTALARAVNGSEMGAGFRFGTVYQVVLNCPSVAAAGAVTLSGGTADLLVNQAEVVRAGAIVVS